MHQEDILPRYLQLRAISTRLHAAALERVAWPSLMEQAKHLRLLEWPDVLTASDSEMTLLYDLAVHTARPGRSRAVDRGPRHATADTDDGLVQAALRQARFSIWRLDRWHAELGVIVTDTLRGGETWVIDLGLAFSAKPGMLFASRLCWPAEFAITCGALAPVSADLMDEVLFDIAGWLHHLDLAKAADDARFATAVYANAILAGCMDGVEYRPAVAAE